MKVLRQIECPNEHCPSHPLKVMVLFLSHMIGQCPSCKEFIHYSKRWNFYWTSFKEWERKRDHARYLANPDYFNSRALIWQKNNPDKFKQVKAKCYQKHKVEYRAHTKAKYWENPEPERERSRNYWRRKHQVVKQ
jgi:hypothetical protein